MGCKDNFRVHAALGLLRFAHLVLKTLSLPGYQLIQSTSQVTEKILRWDWQDRDAGIHSPLSNGPLPHS